MIHGRAYIFRSASIVICLSSVIVLANPPAVAIQRSDSSIHPRWFDNDNQDIPVPEVIKENKNWDIIDHVFFYEVGKTLDLGWSSRKIGSLIGISSKKEAVNVNSLDEVPNSSWFSNRHFLEPMTPEEMSKGPDITSGPDTSGIWEIVAGKFEGVTVGFTIKDSNGDLYVLKFDPPGRNELASGAEIISTKLFYAAGYNVPQNFITYFDPGILKVGKPAKVKGEDGLKRPMTDADLSEMLTKLAFEKNGYVRGAASKLLEGKPVGPFNFDGRRKDDSNDRIDHQHRRELRGMRVLSALLNDTDRRAANTLDMYVIGDNGRKYVRHYIIDFGSTLGSKFHQNQLAKYGNEYIWDISTILKSFLSLGLYEKEWVDKQGPINDAIGYYESKIFRADRWVPSYPNPAFENITDRDGYWGAKTVMSFSDEHLRAVISTANYSDSWTFEYMYNTLRSRRDKIGRYWFSKVNPLDLFKVVSDGKKDVSFSFRDLWVDGNLDSLNSNYYEVTLSRPEGSVIEKTILKNKRSLELPDGIERFSVTLRTKRGKSGEWSKKTEVDVSFDSEHNRYIVTAIRRDS